MSLDFYFAPNLNLGLDNFKFEVGRLGNFFELFRPRVNFGRKQKDDLKKFCSRGTP